MAYELDQAGKFRANPFANSENAVRLVDRDTPGTAGTDSGTVALAGKTTIQGIKYTGKDGVNEYLPFTMEDPTTQKLIPYSLAASATPKQIQDAVHELINRQEVDSIVTITENGTTSTSIDIEHTGSGTLTALVVDGTDEALSRGAVAAGGVGVASAGESKSKSKKK